MSRGRIMPVRLEEAKALGDELRLIILGLLRERPLSVGEIMERLREMGIVKTPNTIRYHLAILKDSGLVELVRTGKTYRYAARGTYYAYTSRPGADKEVERLARAVEPLVWEAVDVLVREHGEELLRLAEKFKPCELCITRHFVEQVIYEACRSALSRVLAEHPAMEKLNSRAKLEGEPGQGKIEG